MDGFAVRDSIGTSLQDLDKRARQRLNIIDVSRAFQFGAEDVAGLEQEGMPLNGENAAGLIAACWDANGAAQWTTLVLPYAPTVANNGKTYYTVRDPMARIPELPLSGFEWQAIGYPSIVRMILTAKEPISESLATDNALKLYYDRKRAGRLNDFTLSEAVDLARVLVKSTIALSPTEAGVGGPIDVAVLTPQGFSWISRKPKFAPFPPSHFVRAVASTFEGGAQPLDGMEFVLCTFRNTKLTFAGTRDVQLLGPEFLGACELVLGPGARQAMPETVSRLKALVADKCKVVDENSISGVPQLR